MSDFQEDPVLDRDGLRQIKRYLACLVHTVGCGAIGACFPARELQLAGFQKIRHVTSIARHIWPAAPSAKSVPTRSTPAHTATICSTSAPSAHGSVFTPSTGIAISTPRSATRN